MYTIPFTDGLTHVVPSSLCKFVDSDLSRSQKEVVKVTVQLQTYSTVLYRENSFGRHEEVVSESSDSGGTPVPRPSGGSLIAARNNSSARPRPTPVVSSVGRKA